MKRSKKMLAMVTTLLLILILTVPVSAAGKISKSKATLVTGQKMQLKLSGTKGKVKWSSSKKSVAAVSSKGVVTAKKKGSATITAKVGKKKYTCKVTVEAPRMNKQMITLNVKKSVTLKLTGTKQKIKWSSSNKNVAIVNKKGKVTAKNAGSADIIATVSGMKYVCRVIVAGKGTTPVVPVNTPVPVKPTEIPVEPTKVPVQPTQAPEPTAIPQPTKAPVQPTEVPKTTSTPTPVPTATPTPIIIVAPTSTPGPIKATRVRFNPYPVNYKLTRRYPTYKLEVEILPHNAEPIEYKLTSSDTSVATVDADGTVTGVGDGTVTIYVEAADSLCEGDSIQFDVDVIRKPFNSQVSLEGGDTKSFEIADYSDFDITDFSEVEFNYSDPDGIIGDVNVNCDSSSYKAFGFRAYRKGTITVTATYGEKLLGTWNVTINSDWTDYFGYVAWRHSVESQIWNDNMPLREKMDAARDYIKTNFKYGTEVQPDGYKTYAAIYAWQEGYHFIDCFGSSELLGDFAKDAGAQMKYVSTHSDQMYDDFIDATSNAGGHLFNIVLIDGEWVSYDAQPPHVPHN